MPDKPIRDPRILEAIEACRPASEDLKDPALAFLATQLEVDPELRELFERCQRVDATLAEAFRDVPVPEGLADRITARLAAVRNGQGASGEGFPSVGHESAPPNGRAATTAVPGPIAQVARTRRRVLRRWLLAGAGGMAVAASLLVALIVARQQPPALERAEVLDGAIEFFDSDWDQVGQLAAESQPPRAYPAGPEFDVAKFPQIRWRLIADFLGCEGVAYDMARPGGARATLYVVKCTVPNLPGGPPLTPLRTTGNRSVGAWQTGGLLYVLVVEGGNRTYQSFLPRPTWT